MQPCAGHLVIHHDGTLVDCTADLSEVGCADHSPARHRIILRCWSIMPHGLCGYCRSVARLAAAPAQARATEPPASRSA